MIPINEQKSAPMGMQISRLKETKHETNMK